MVKIFRESEKDEVSRTGYTAKYVADVVFEKNLNSGGFILVKVEAGTRTQPHRHAEIEEIFVALSDLKMYIDNVEYDLHSGDVALVAPKESHSFEASEDSPGNLLAIKFPNLKNDKITQ